MKEHINVPGSLLLGFDSLSGSDFGSEEIIIIGSYLSLITFINFIYLLHCLQLARSRPLS